MGHKHNHHRYFYAPSWSWGAYAPPVTTVIGGGWYGGHAVVTPYGRPYGFGFY